MTITRELKILKSEIIKIYHNKIDIFDLFLMKVGLKKPSIFLPWIDKIQQKGEYFTNKELDELFLIYSSGYENWKIISEIDKELKNEIGNSISKYFFLDPDIFHDILLSIPSHLMTVNFAARVIALFQKETGGIYNRFTSIMECLDSLVDLHHCNPRSCTCHYSYCDRISCERYGGVFEASFELLSIFPHKDIAVKILYLLYRKEIEIIGINWESRSFIANKSVSTTLFMYQSMLDIGNYYKEFYFCLDKILCDLLELMKNTSIEDLYKLNIESKIHNLFEKVLKILEIASSRINVIKTSQTLKQEMMSDSSLFFHKPRELLSQISAHSRDEKYLSYKEAEGISSVALRVNM